MSKDKRFILAACAGTAICLWYCLYGANKIESMTPKKYTEFNSCYKTVCIDGRAFVSWTCGGGLAQALDNEDGQVFKAVRCSRGSK